MDDRLFCALTATAIISQPTVFSFSLAKSAACIDVYHLCNLRNLWMSRL
jgi:hypothetical protein